MWITIQVIFFALGILGALGGNRLSMPVLTNAGIACFGLAGMAVGWEAITTRQIKFGSRLRGSRETYKGIPAILQGIQLNLIGLFFIGVSILLYLNLENTGVLSFCNLCAAPEFRW